MSRDYKNISKSARPPGLLLGHLLSVLTGLAIGLLIAFLVYIYNVQPARQTDKQPAIASTPTLEPKQPAAKEEPQVPEPTFDFYTILPDREVNISEWVEENEGHDKPTEEASVQDGNLYVFQVGSFEDYQSADQLKARLALIGIKADIQRVVINGEETRHRVRVGPYQDQEQIRETRERLLANNLEFMFLRLNMDDI